MKISIDMALGGKTYTFTPEIVNSFIVVFVLCIIGFIIGRKAKKADFKKNPKGILLWGEIFVEFIQGLVSQTMGKGNQGFVPYIGSLALFLAFSNLLGLVGLLPPTSNYNVTLGLALITVTLTHVNNIRFNGVKNYVKGYFEPVAFLSPINLLGELATPISLSFRLFGNIISGVIITTLLYSAVNSISVYVAPFLTPIFHAYFDVFAGLIQTFVFMMLTMINISQAIGDRE
ncbi:F0F1 ATP synthase subunit A [Helcococcus sueciensis]|uniref:F0F1 ATP synthase subunit A n=1 Tax=Helcococcus sueciensis TaxID=241555 RepID=UPI0004175884|nr:F0F1 ATP synthase subunit A [Helcococcus sueciensis]